MAKLYLLRCVNPAALQQVTNAIGSRVRYASNLSLPKTDTYYDAKIEGARIRTHDLRIRKLVSYTHTTTTHVI